MGRRLALLIATNEYQDDGLRRLRSPEHDPAALAAVLGDPAIAGFELMTLINESHQRIGVAISELYQSRARDDVTLLYVVGYGLVDETGGLHLATSDTLLTSLPASSLPAERINQAISSCASRQNVLVLDCCHGGVFPAGGGGATAAHTLERLRGPGRTVVTASDALQYSFEDGRLVGDAVWSAFTRSLVAGLRDGAADLDGDGDITLDDLYGYVHDRVSDETPRHRPTWQDATEGRIVIARNTNWRLPARLRNGLDSPIVTERLAALDGLTQLFRLGNDQVRARVASEIRALVEDDSRTVSNAAAERVRRLGLMAGSDATSAWLGQPPSQPEPGSPKPTETIEGVRRWIGNRRRRVVVGGAAAMVVVAGAVAAAVFAGPSAPDSHITPRGDATPHGHATTQVTATPLSVAQITSAAEPSIVTVTVGESNTGTAVGAGFVFDSRGDILSTADLTFGMSDGSPITVKFTDGQSYPAAIVGKAERDDIMVLKLTKVPNGLPPPLRLGDSDAVSLGDSIVAIGSAQAHPNTVTTGYVTEKNRVIAANGKASTTVYLDVLQVDATIALGDSGGPLLDDRGRVVGVLAAATTDTTSSPAAAPSGFAIPINQADQVADQLVRTGKPVYPLLGVLLNQNYTGNGAQVEPPGGSSTPAVVPGGPGARAGLEPGDVIVAFDGEPVTNANTLAGMILAHHPGEKVTVNYLRGSASHVTELVLGSQIGDS